MFPFYACFCIRVLFNLDTMREKNGGQRSKMLPNDSVLLDYPFWSKDPNREEPSGRVLLRPKVDQKYDFEIDNGAEILVLGTLRAGNLGS